MRGAVVFFSVLVFGGCSDSPSDGGPTAEVVAEGGSFSDCQYFFGFFFCDFLGVGRNLGPDCAEDVRGVTRFYNVAGGQVGPADSWLGPSHLTPGQGFTYILTTLPAAVSYQTEASWTSARC